MLHVHFKTLANAEGNFTSSRPQSVDKWLTKFKSPNGFKVTVKDQDGDIVGTKEFGATTISWDFSKKVAKEEKREVIGCKSTIASLDAITVQKAKELGGGNMSLGIRLAVSIAYSEKVGEDHLEFAG